MVYLTHMSKEFHVGGDVARLTAVDYRLPDRVFMPDMSCEVEIAGRTLRCSTSSLPARIDIYDPAAFLGLGDDTPESFFPTAHFQAWLENFKDHSKLKWSVKNWDTQSPEPGAKHPGIHPGWLLARSLECLGGISIEQGLDPIRYLEGRWKRPDPTAPYMFSNWEALQAAKADPAIMDLPPEEQQAAAIFTTPTGRLAMQNGFSIVARFVESDEESVVVFERTIPTPTT